MATVQGESVTVMSTDTEVMIDGSTVVMADVMASNGLVHVIDRVMLPQSIRTALELPAYDAMSPSAECMSMMMDQTMDETMDEDVSGGVSSVS